MIPFRPTRIGNIFRFRQNVPDPGRADREHPALRSGPGVGAWLGFVHGALIGYAAHRLATKLLGEPDPRTVIASEHVGFYWRAGTALWWGVLLAAFCWRFPGLEARLRTSLIPMVILVVLVVTWCR